MRDEDVGDAVPVVRGQAEGVDVVPGEVVRDFYTRLELQARRHVGYAFLYS